MQIYLPIADLPVNVFVILAMGLAVGFISGMFGIGGGFLMTPLLIFLGISPAVAVASVTGHIAASSMSGAISYWHRKAIDLALAFMLLAGGIIGTAFGVWLFTTLRAIGQLDITIGVSYVLLLGIVGALMVIESVRAILRARQGKPVELRRTPEAHTATATLRYLPVAPSPGGFSCPKCQCGQYRSSLRATKRVSASKTSSGTVLRKSRVSAA